MTGTVEEQEMNQDGEKKEVEIMVEITGLEKKREETEKGLLILSCLKLQPLEFY